MYSVICLSLSFSLVLSVNSEKPTVRITKNGPVEGVELTSVYGQTFYAFKGIPYAEPPITGIDPYTGETVDRRFKVYCQYVAILNATFLLFTCFMCMRLGTRTAQTEMARKSTRSKSI